MLKETVSINENSNPAATLKVFRESCRRTNVKNPDDLIAQVEAAVKEFVDRGSELVAVGSQFQIKRVLSGDDYEVTLDVSFGVKRSVVSRIKSLFSS